MSPENILNRRLQTQVYLQGLASTVKQSRQLIIHGHIAIDGAVTRVPGMLVTKLQEKNITYSSTSALNSDLHPVRPGTKETFDDYEEDKKEESNVKEDAEEKVEKETESKVNEEIEKTDKTGEEK